MLKLKQPQVSASKTQGISRDCDTSTKPAVFAEHCTVQKVSRIVSRPCSIEENLDLNPASAMMMWMDRELEEHQVYDHFATATPIATGGPGGGMQQLPPAPNPNCGGLPNGNAGIYAHLQQHQQQQHNSSTPTTTNSMGMDSSLGGGSPTPMTIDLDHDGPLHQHSTLPAVDHRLPMDNHHMDDSVQDIYGTHQQHLYHQPHQLMSPAMTGGDQTGQHLMVNSNSSCLGGQCYADQGGRFLPFFYLEN